MSTVMAHWSEGRTSCSNPFPETTRGLGHCGFSTTRKCRICAVPGVGPVTRADRSYPATGCRIPGLRQADVSATVHRRRHRALQTSPGFPVDLTTPPLPHRRASDGIPSLFLGHIVGMPSGDRSTTALATELSNLFGISAGQRKLHESDLSKSRVEVSGQLSNQDIREEIGSLWALTRHFD